MPVARWFAREMLLRIVGLVLFDVFGLLLVTCSASMLVHGTLESVWFLCSFGGPGVIVGNALVYCVLVESKLCFYMKYVMYIRQKNNKSIGGNKRIGGTFCSKLINE